MTLPRILLIGAMKSGTTSLYADLCTQPGVWFCDPKEPGNLASDRVLTPRGLADYEYHFRGCPAGALAGDASTIYAKLPEAPGVPERAVRVLGDAFRVLYIVREPVSRALSQHFHELSEHRDTMPSDPDRAVREVPRLWQYSQYAMQLEPWRAAIGDDRIRVVIFEEFIQSRRDTIASLCQWLGVPCDPSLIDESSVHNQGEARVVATGFLRKVQDSRPYQRLIRPLLPPSARRKIVSAVTPPPPPRPGRPSMDTIEYLIDKVKPDAEKLAAYLGRTTPIWDFDAVRAKHAKA
jgi:hypothetical protein